MNDPREFCEKIDAWAALMSASAASGTSFDGTSGFSSAWGFVRLAIGKSCLLDRMLYGGERPSETACPVHEGEWSGSHLGWPGQTWKLPAGGTQPVEESPLLRQWYDAGCRCFGHKCGCTTGWQPDAACGCVPAVS